MFGITRLLERWLQNGDTNEDVERVQMTNYIEYV